MAGFTNTAELEILRAFLVGTDMSFRTNPNWYFALFTGDPTDLGTTGTEATYTGYARVAIPKASSFTEGSPFVNTSLIQSPKCTGGNNDITHFGLFTASSGGSPLIIGTLNSTLSVSNNGQPQFNAGTLAFGLD